MFLAQDNHLKDFMEAVDAQKCSRGLLNALSSKQLRLAFFGLFRKDPFASLDTFPGLIIIANQSMWIVTLQQNYTT